MLYKIISNRTPFNTAESPGSMPLLEQVEHRLRTLEDRAAQLEEEHTFAQKVIDIQRSLLAVRTIPDLIHLLHDEFNILGAVEYDVQHYPDGTFSVEAMDYFGKGHSQDYTERFRFTQEPENISSRFNMWRTVQQQRTTFITEGSDARTIKFLIPINLSTEVSKVFKVEVAAPSSLRNTKDLKNDVRKRYSLLQKYHSYFAEMLHAAFIRIETLKAPLEEKRYYEKIIEATSKLTDLFDEKGIVNTQVADIFVKSLMDIFGYSEIALYRYDRSSGQLDERARSIRTNAEKDYPTVNTGEDFTPKGVKKMFLMLCIRSLEDTGFGYLFEQGIIRWITDQGKPLMLQIIDWFKFKRPEGYPEGQVSVEEECVEQINDDITLNYRYGIITSTRLPSSIGRHIRKKLFMNPEAHALRPKQRIENIEQLRTIIGKAIPEKDLETLFHLFEKAHRIDPAMFKQLGLIPFMTNDRYIDFLMVRKLRASCDAEKELDIAPAIGSEKHLAFTKGLNMIINDYNMIIKGLYYQQKLQELQPTLGKRIANIMHGLKTQFTQINANLMNLVKHLNNIQGHARKDAEAFLAELAAYENTHYHDTTYLQHLLERQRSKSVHYIHINDTLRSIERTILGGRIGNAYTSLAARRTDLMFTEQLSASLLDGTDLMQWVAKVNLSVGHEKYRIDREHRTLTVKVERTGMTPDEFSDIKRTCTLQGDDAHAIELLNSYSKVLNAYDHCLSLAMTTENTMISIMNRPSMVLEGLAGEETTSFNVLEHLAEIIDECKNSPAFKDIEIGLLPIESPLDNYMITTDKETLGYCLKNMFENARKAIRISQEEPQLIADLLPAEIRNDQGLMSLFFEDPEEAVLALKPVRIEKHTERSLVIYNSLVTPLIDRALAQARQKKYRITVSVDVQEPSSRLTDKKFLTISVHDNGAGLSDSRLTTINNVLFKENTRTPENKMELIVMPPDPRFRKHALGSTGFGLQYSAQYIKSLGGRIGPMRSGISRDNEEVRSGTTISTTIPVSIEKKKKT